MGEWPVSKPFGGRATDPTAGSRTRAQMVSNLLVVLCSDQRTQPVVNTGSLYA